MLDPRSPAVCALSGSRKTATGLINSDVTALYQSQIRIYGSDWVIPREVAQENPRPPSILMKIDKPIVPHDRNMYAQF